MYQLTSRSETLPTLHVGYSLLSRRQSRVLPAVHYTLARLVADKVRVV
jgi:hypothetical protein